MRTWHSRKKGLICFSSPYTAKFICLYALATSFFPFPFHFGISTPQFPPLMYYFVCQVKGYSKQSDVIVWLGYGGYYYPGVLLIQSSSKKKFFACTFVCKASAYNLFIVTGSSYSTIVGTNRFGFWRSNALDLEICSGRCSCRCCNPHTINWSFDSNASSGTTFRALPWWCFSGEGHGALVLQDT